MEGARVGIFDSDPVMQDLIARYVEADGHKIVTRAMNLFESVRVINAIPQLDVGIVESNYAPRKFDGADGDFIARMLREKYGETVIIIGTSDTNDLEAADFKIRKTELEGLRGAIGQLPARRQSA